MDLLKGLSDLRVMYVNPTGVYIVLNGKVISDSLVVLQMKT